MTNYGGPNPIGGPQWQPPQQPPQPQQPPPPQPQQPWPPQPQQQWQPQPPPGPGYPPGPSFGPPITPRPPARNRRRLIIAGAGALIAVIVLVAGFVVFGGSGDSSGGNRTPVDAMRSYLEALAAGDAEKALSFAVNEPAEKSLLTDEILQKQLEKMPITDITVTETSGTGGVQVMATFGDIAIDETVYLKESADGGSWKLENAALPLDFRKDGGDESPALIDQITLFGEKMPASGRPYVFPGWVDIANSNPNVTTLIAPEEPVFLLDRLDYGENVNYGFETSEAGQEAVKKAIMALLVECAKSTELSPPNCPQNAASARVQGTARWTAPTDLDDLDFTGTIDNKGMQGVMGSVEFMVTLDATDPIFSRDNSPAPYWFEGKADMAQIPPTFTIRKAN